mgnify:CR=1 FL=1
MTTPVAETPRLPRPTEELDQVVIRFSGDSGDGMQITGSQFTNTSAVLGNDLATFPDFPAEIRAPTGTTFGVSGFQLNFSSKPVFTPGDQPDVLVAMNPAALKVNLADLKVGGLLIVNKDAFANSSNLERAGYNANPIESGALSAYHTVSIDISQQTERALEGSGLSFKEVSRAKNFWTLGLLYYLYHRPLELTLKFIDEKFVGVPEIAEANRKVLKAGYMYGEVSELFHETYTVKPATLKPGTYRNITGNQATAWGAIAASRFSGLPLFFGSYPITPASDVLHELSKYKNFGVTTFQAEDEIAAVCAAIGASFTGAFAVTSTSGPGVALKSEAINLGVSVELPLVIIDVQRGGPSTGLPTKTEQADLLQAMFGRNGDSPVAIVAPATPSDCFDMFIEASRIALKYMVPVIFMSDGYLGNGSEPWRIPLMSELPKVEYHYAPSDGNFSPYKRDPETLARPWAVPGQKGMEHRIGGIEKSAATGDISYDPRNHHEMTLARAERVARIARDIPLMEITGPSTGDLLLLGWGGTYGAITSAAEAARKRGLNVSSAHIRYLNPFPSNLGDVLSGFKKVMIPELNNGQLSLLIRGKFLVDAVGFNKISGQPFKIAELEGKIDEMLGLAGPYTFDFGQSASLGG